jgi:hypothetical protein
MDQVANGIINRAIRVSKLDLPVFREISRDGNATKEAAIVVAVVALAAGIGALTDSLWAVILSVISAFLYWTVFSAMTYFFGKNIFGTPTTQVDVESLMRTLGFAQAPRILYLLGFIWVLGPLVAFVGWCWALVASVVAIRETLQVSTARAVIVGLVASIASAIILTIIGLITGIGYAF